MISFDAKYSIPISFPTAKPQRGKVIGCAVCGKTRVTILSREGERFCQKCYAGLLALRALQKEGMTDEDVQTIGKENANKERRAGMKKKKVLKRALEISVDLLCRTECCIVEDVKICPIEAGTLDSCDQCVKRYIMQKARHELREDKLRKDVKAIQAQAAAARARNAEEKRQEGKN